jgi:transcriptional regulator with XRE-family HTH domain
MSLGETLRKARQERDLTASQVAHETRMKVQIVEAIEREAFDRMPAPIYAKGFIKLYAEHMGLDPAPLIAEYEAQSAGLKKPSLVSKSKKRKPEPAAPPDTAEEQAEPDLFSEDRPARRESKPRPGVSRRRRKPGTRLAAKAAASTARAFRERLTARLGAIRGRLAGRDSSTPAAGEETAKSDSPPTVPNTPLRILSVVIGIVVILVFLASGLSRCFGPAQPETGPTLEDVAEDLDLVIEPPEPYID